MSNVPPKRVSPTDAPAEAVERVARTRGVSADRGDIVIVREPAGRLATMGTWRYTLRTHGDVSAGRYFARYDAAAIEGEQLASRLKVRLLYIEDGQPVLLMDYRQSSR